MSSIALGAALALSVSSGPSLAAGTPSVTPPQSEELHALIEAQRQEIEAQKKAIEAQRERIEALETATDDLKTITLSLTDPSIEPAFSPPRGIRAARYGPGSEGYYSTNGAIQPALYHIPPQNRRYAQAEPQETQPPAGPPPPSLDKERPEVAVLAEQGGVLIPQGTFVVEPSLEYTHSALNRFFFEGIEIFDVILIGDIEATKSDRDTIVAAGTLRYGVTPRLEVEAKVPFVYRDDRVTNLIISPPSSEVTTETTGYGLGDVEVAAHYQFNNGEGGSPFYVGNVRLKTPTGEGPFDVDRDTDGIETEMPTGSGFWGVQPSLTVIFPSDPAVFFGNLSYLWNIERNVDKTIGGSDIGTVDPGDVIGVSFGMGMGINEKASFSLGYAHNYVLESTTEIGGVEVESTALQVGSFLFGLSYRLSDSVGLHLTTEIGVTEDAPDLQLLLRLPISFSF